MTPDIKIAGAVANKHYFDLPLDYSQPQGQKIQIFARELVAVDSQDKDLPYLVFFQGGPGFAAARPTAKGGWIKRALKEYRVLLLDQRGTGLSTPVSAATLAGLSPQQQADYFSHLRADNIVRDAEAIRAQLSPNKPWSILGQSFGGFCVLRYLSAAAQGVKEAYLTGGIPSLTRPADEVYQATYKRLLTKNQDFFERFSDAQQLMTELAEYISTNEVLLDSGEKLTVEMLQLLGIAFGGESGPEAVYYLIEQALVSQAMADGSVRKIINPLFLSQFSQMLDYNTNPIYTLLHEAIYCQGDASNWSAERVRQQYPEFNWQSGQPFLFTGEMVYPWFCDQFKNLKSLKEAANILAEKTDWPELYDLDILKNNTVPAAAAIYSEDMYVEMQYSLETVAKVNHLKYWLTSEYEHNGLRMDGEKILDRLIAINRGEQLH
ncbi:alpha/beta fold hydrolase [Pelagibaculum spongiae]|uniref:Alpha/beta hydrolase n=1 Tax=Pelagibaculum spongiae TaxID=2080658 RepID=A0A2V1GYI8_9GAMM|nr:alpha/beta fold hydrolase [Pelagibaculum spongiae]PVZ67592.1 alpha/beta hydrolase [Pelagibaculum spongiae]